MPVTCVTGYILHRQLTIEHCIPFDCDTCHVRETMGVFCDVGVCHREQ